MGLRIDRAQLAAWRASDERWHAERAEIAHARGETIDPLKPVAPAPVTWHPVRTCPDRRSQCSQCIEWLLHEWNLFGGAAELERWVTVSYSRWSNSRWYTYWDANSPEGDQDAQVFTICDITNPHAFTYRVLKDDLEGCIATVQAGEGDAPDNPKTVPDYLELRAYMLRFVLDVERNWKEI